MHATYLFYVYWTTGGKIAKCTKTGSIVSALALGLSNVTAKFDTHVNNYVANSPNN